MKGAIDGGIHIPHNSKIFPQKKVEKKAKVIIPPIKEKGKKDDKKEKEEKKKKAAEPEEEGEFDGTLLRERIFGKHVQDWMNAYDKKKINKITNFLNGKNA